MLSGSPRAILAGSLAGGFLTHWMVSSLVNDVPGRGWYHDSCTLLVNAAILRSGINYEWAASVISWLVRAAAPSIAVLTFLGLSGLLTVARGAIGVCLACLFACASAVIDPAFLPDDLSTRAVVIYEVARALIGGLLLMWIIAPREACAPEVVAERKAAIAPA